MPSQNFFVRAFLYLLLYVKINAVQNEEDFAFDGNENLKVGFEEQDVHTAQAWADDQILTATVGRIFHLDLATRKEFAGKAVAEYEVSNITQFELIEIF